MITDNKAILLPYYKNQGFINLVGSFMMVVLLFFCTTNVLFGFALDKIMMFLVSAGILLLNPENKIFTSKELFLILSIFVIPFISCIVNVVFFPMIFFPVIGIVFSITSSRYAHMVLNAMYYAILIHMLLGLYFVILAFAGFPNPYVYSLGGKGFHFLYSERGFTATVQTFGTICLTWLLIYFLRRELGLNTAIDKMFFIINCIAILASLNRSTYLFWMIIIFLKERKLFIAIIALLGVFLIKFWSQIISFITVASSITARSELLQGFKLSFLQSYSMKVYLFGKGTNELPKEIVAKVKWNARSDIENGYAMLLHTYGSLGLFFYIITGIYLLSRFVRLRKWSETFILFYFLYVTPYFTQEFVSVTFYLFLAVILLMLNVHNSKTRSFSS